MLIIVILIVIVVLIPAVLGAILYVMVFGLVRGPRPQPALFLNLANLDRGNATLTVLTPSGDIDPSGLHFLLQANRSDGPEFGMPMPNGFVSVMAGRYTLRFSWFDQDQDRVLGTGDTLLVTGDLAPLPARTDFLLSVRSGTGSMFDEVSWSMP